MTGQIYCRAVDLLEAEINDELVALDPARGSCFGLNNVAANVWRKLEQPRSFEQLRSDLLDEYDVSETQCTDELEKFLEQMQAKGLVAIEPASGNRDT